MEPQVDQQEINVIQILEERVQLDVKSSEQEQPFMVVEEVQLELFGHIRTGQTLEVLVEMAEAEKVERQDGLENQMDVQVHQQQQERPESQIPEAVAAEVAQAAKKKNFLEVLEEQEL